MYMSKLIIAFVQIAKGTCLNWKLYLSQQSSYHWVYPRPQKSFLALILYLMIISYFVWTGEKIVKKTYLRRPGRDCFAGGTKAAVIRGDVWLIPHENNSSVALQIDHTSPCLRKKLNFVRILTNRKCANILYKNSLLLRKRTCTVLNVNVILLVTHWCSPVANLC